MLDDNFYWNCIVVCIFFWIVIVWLFP